MLKPASLLLLRVGTGLLLVIWGIIKVSKPDSGVGVSDKYYGGIVSVEAIQAPWGVLQIIVGLLVVIGLFRRFVYPLQALMLIVGALAIWRYLLDPLGLYLLNQETANVLFFPSVCVAAACLALIGFREFDSWSLDALRKPPKSDSTPDEARG